MAAKKIELRTAWPDDRFEVGDQYVDGRGVWGPDGKPVNLTQTRAQELLELAAANRVQLQIRVDDEPQPVPDQTPEG